MKKTLFAIAILALSFSANAAAIEEIIVLAGRADNVSPELAGVIEIGQDFSATFNFDIDTSPISQTLNNAEYLFEGEFGAIVIGDNSIPGSEFRFGSIDITNDFELPNGDPGGDLLSFGLLEGDFDEIGWLLESASVGLTDLSGSAIDGTSLDELIDLTAADFSSAVFTLFFREIAPNPLAAVGPQAATGPIVVSGPITSISVTAVPIPAAMWLFGSGFLGFFLWAKRMGSGRS